jgi:hypothetical protein
MTPTMFGSILGLWSRLREKEQIGHTPGILHC